MQTLTSVVRNSLPGTFTGLNKTVEAAFNRKKPNSIKYNNVNSPMIAIQKYEFSFDA